MGDIYIGGFFRIYPSLSLQAIGLLTIVLEEAEGKFQFNTLDDFMHFFRIKNYAQIEEIFNELVELDIIQRKVHSGTITVTFIDHPGTLLQYSVDKDNTRLKQLIKNGLDKTDKRLEDILFNWEASLNASSRQLTLKRVEEFFDIFNKAPKTAITKFLSIYRIQSLQNKSLPYLKAVFANINLDITKTKKTMSDDFKYDGQKRNKMEQTLASRLVNGTADKLTKYQIMLSNKQYDELNRLYQLGLQDHTGNRHTYDWLVS